MGTMTQAAPTAQSAQTVDAVRQHLELIKEHLNILRHLNAAPQVLEVVQQALHDTEENLRQLSAPADAPPNSFLP